jgi:hypothetical protein
LYDHGGPQEFSRDAILPLNCRDCHRFKKQHSIALSTRTNSLTIYLNSKKNLMLLQNRIAVIYGAGGSLGSEIARSLSKEGAMVFAAGNRTEPLKNWQRRLPVREAALN